MPTSTFLAQADARYRTTNKRSLEWALSRSHDGPWINTKFNPVERRNYTAADGLRGPAYLYGWIQGRALEALVQHSRHFSDDDSHFSATLLDRACQLYHALDELYRERDHACFCYNQRLLPVTTGGQPPGQQQHRDPQISTYSDLFVVKGLIAASACLAPEHLERHVLALEQIVQAIESSHFLMDESDSIDQAALERQTQDFGPRMIALGAASLLHSLELQKRDNYSTRFIQHILEQHTHPASGLVSNTPAGQILNAGHAIEMIGFYFETWGDSLPNALVTRLAQLLADVFTIAFDGQGLRLSIDLTSKTSNSELSPWWSLPETIRAAALAFELTQDPRFLQIWQVADTAFFRYFWLDTPPLAVQMIRNGRAVDVVPATPDLDPGYHTGLSLLAASDVCRRLLNSSTTH